MTPQERRAKLRHWLGRLSIDPIDPDDERYVALEEAGRGAVDDIYSLIDLAFDPTTQLLSGPRGSGKTTELRRLRRNLEEAGYTVALVDVLSYVNQSTKVDATEFLIAVALGVGEQLEQQAEEATEGFPSRFRGFLQRLGVSVEAGPVKVSASGERVTAGIPGLSVDIDLKKELKRSEPLVEELRRKLAFHLGELYDEVAGYFRELVAEDRERRPDSRGLVIIIDSLEKVRGTTQNDAEVQASVEALFVHHSDKLRFPSHHMVYTVPPYLMFTDPGALPFDGTVRPVPIP